MSPASVQARNNQGRIFGQHLEGVTGHLGGFEDFDLFFLGQDFAGFAQVFLIESGGFGVGGTEHGDAHLLTGHLAAQGLGEADDGVLAAAVAGVAKEAHQAPQ